MPANRMFGQVRNALDLETDDQVVRWTSLAVSAFLRAVPDERLRQQIMMQFPDRLREVVEVSSRRYENASADPDALGLLLDCEPARADHLLRVVWIALTDILSPSDLTRMKVTFPEDVAVRIARYEGTAEQEELALRAEMAEYRYVPEESPEGAVLAGGDLDAAWKDAEGGGEETVGGSVVTPDQDVVDEIGEALGVTYRYDEILRPVEKESERDRLRWELDPASSEDYLRRSSRKKHQERKRS